MSLAFQLIYQRGVGFCRSVFYFAWQICFNCDVYSYQLCRYHVSYSSMFTVWTYDITLRCFVEYFSGNVDSNVSIPDPYGRVSTFPLSRSKLPLAPNRMVVRECFLTSSRCIDRVADIKFTTDTTLWNVTLVIFCSPLIRWTWTYKMSRYNLAVFWFNINSEKTINYERDRFDSHEIFPCRVMATLYYHTV